MAKTRGARKNSKTAPIAKGVSKSDTTFKSRKAAITAKEKNQDVRDDEEEEEVVDDLSSFDVYNVDKDAQLYVTVTTNKEIMAGMYPNNCHLPMELSMDDQNTDEVYRFVKDISNVDFLKKKCDDMRILDRQMIGYLGRQKPYPVSYMADEFFVVSKARDLLQTLKDTITALEEARKARDVDHELLEELERKKLIDSSAFFQQVPLVIIPPHSTPIFRNHQDVLSSMEVIDQLQQMEIAGRILAGASARHDDCDSIKYINAALKCRFRQMDRDEEMSKRILFYIMQSVKESYSRVEIGPHWMKLKGMTIMGMFEIRKGNRFLRFGPYRNEPEQLYLWHGVKPESLISILRKGFMPTYSDEIQLGHQYRKGVHFSDSFERCDRFCRESADGMRYMLLSQVAPGKTKGYSQLTPYENDFDTLVVEGRRGPARSKDVVVDGVTMPCGNLISQRVDELVPVWSKYIVQNPKRSFPKYIVVYK